MTQRNEGPILERWLAHYAGLFGWDSLTVFDNCSTDQATIEMLHAARARGSKVVFGVESYREKHTMALGLIHAYEVSDESRADFYFPVDCDEYLCTLTGTSLSLDRTDILAELVRYRYEVQGLQIPGSLYNDPGRENCYVLDRPFIKSFFRSGAIGTLDIGHHFATSPLAEGTHATRLMYLHHHNKALEAAKETARSKLRYAEAIDYHGGGASYLRALIACSEQEYLARYDRQLKIELQPDGIMVIFPDGSTAPWCGAMYLRGNPEVARDYAFGALHHYLTMGYDQGRGPQISKVAVGRWR
jgi:hypothetical protein